MTKKAHFVGNIGEKIAEMFLMKHGYSIKGRNMARKWGEIDIIAVKEGILSFIEVKTRSIPHVSRETREDHFPEAHVTHEKFAKVSRAIGSYILENKWEGEYTFGVVAVLIDENTEEGFIRFYPDCVL